SYRERRGAAHARRATELYSVSTARERNAAGADASTFECKRIYGTGYSARQSGCGAAKYVDEEV
ncbi:MAG: hypothetical protein KKE79_07095, partial [Actinobacteria bacterium]|nr:hypothetical protein [Actinomycetota bacterium]MCG2796143.1 hypothetical protein [Actinomycetes bacterium]